MPGLPIHALLVGPARRRARVCCRVRAATREEMLARCLERTSQSFVAIGHLNPFLDERGRTASLMVDLTASLMGRRVFDRPTQSF